MPDEQTSLSSLEEANRREREITLEGPKNPDKFKMDDGSTFAETQRRLYEQQREDGEAAARDRAESVREQSTRNDPLYDKGAGVIRSGPGTFTQLPPAAKEVPEQTKEEGKAVEKEAKTEKAEVEADKNATLLSRFNNREDKE